MENKEVLLFKHTYDLERDGNNCTKKINIKPVTAKLYQTRYTIDIEGQEDTFESYMLGQVFYGNTNYPAYFLEPKKEEYKQQLVATVEGFIEQAQNRIEGYNKEIERIKDM